MGLECYILLKNIENERGFFVYSAFNIISVLHIINNSSKT